jgi:hypothetical protein
MTVRRAALLLAIISCCSCGEHDLTRSRDGLLVVPGGIIVSQRDVAQTDDDSVKYRLLHVDPNGSVKYVADRLAQSSWQPLAADWNNGEPNSYSLGWSCHLDTHGRVTYVWVGDWTNAHGDVVTYAFTAPEVHASSDMMVAATLVGNSEVQSRVRAHGEPNLSFSVECLRVLRERR